MTRELGWLLVVSLAVGGCLGVEGSDFGSGGGGDDDDVAVDGDADTDSDSDADTDADTIECPEYPLGGENGVGFDLDQVVQDFSLPGGGLDLEGDTWTMEDFWCMAHEAENPATVLYLNVHSMTCSICLRESSPRLQGWQDTYGPRGLVVWGVSIQDSFEGAQQYWEGSLGATHAWAADQSFMTGQFFEGPVIGTPSWVVVDLTTMEIVQTQEGWSGEAAQISLVEPYLR